MPVAGFDHAAAPAGDPEAIIAFYRALGFDIAGEERWRSGEFPAFYVAAGDQKINFHAPELWQNREFTLKGPTAVPGCGDFCFVWDGTIAEAVDAIAAAGGELIEGPVSREGGRGGGMTEGTSVYTRDPDGNLVEFIVYAEGG